MIVPAEIVQFDVGSLFTASGLAILTAITGAITFICVQAWRIARYTQRTEQRLEQMWTRREQIKFAYELERRNGGLSVPIPDETPRPSWGAQPTERPPV